MASRTTERVKRHRLARGVVRVEVEVPNAADALAVRRFAQSRREAARGETSSARIYLKDKAPQASLETVVGQLSPTERIVVDRFAKALMRAPIQAVIDRAASMAAILEDVAIRVSSVGATGGEGRDP